MAYLRDGRVVASPVRISSTASLSSWVRRLRQEVTAAGSGLLTIFGIGPAGAARILADVGDIARFADRNRFAS